MSEVRSTSVRRDSWGFGPSTAVRLIASFCAAIVACGPDLYVGIARDRDGVRALLDDPNGMFTQRALRYRASLDMACAERELVVEQASGAIPDVAHVSGCGQQDTYFGVSHEGHTRHAPGYEGRVVLSHESVWVRESTAVAEASDYFRSMVAPFELPTDDTWRRDGESYTIHRHIALNAMASRDLNCPRRQVVAYFVRSGRDRTPVGEGCGHRATYLPDIHVGNDPGDGSFVLSATVAMPSPAP